jgi:hypothetical protein
VPAHHHLRPGIDQCIEDRVDLGAGHPEDILDTLGGQHVDHPAGTAQRVGAGQVPEVWTSADRVMMRVCERAAVRVISRMTDGQRGVATHTGADVGVARRDG